MHETYLKLFELPGFKRYESIYKLGKGGCIYNLKLHEINLLYILVQLEHPLKPI